MTSDHVPSLSNFNTPDAVTPTLNAVRPSQAVNGSSTLASAQKKPVVCVFCGASPGKSEVHLEAARALARQLHLNNMSLVYGGGTFGLMGEVAKTLVSLSGPDSVHGIIPEKLRQYEQGDQGIDQAIYGKTTVVKDMHTRKQMMAQAVTTGGPGSGFVALSGGFGTLEELMEITTWNQLGIHKMPVVVYNVDGYYDGLIDWVKGAVKAGFIAPENGGIMVEGKTADEVLHKLKNYEISKARLKLDWDAEG
ncbi:uncharacterized protein PV09_09213 [Verruconis gallopava]|uniref:TIGR00730 family protein n=1 Tax=Verruconis gallopava TaxID=253628 RepID=A0A0D2AJF4_9PEZI|nr:uncharacterized protein PV09_09213 [Verruconis gallopava]KIV99038.1 hypothetical protein PV09_09213 [Verruconis gallopava]